MPRKTLQEIADSYKDTTSSNIPISKNIHKKTLQEIADDYDISKTKLPSVQTYLRGEDITGVPDTTEYKKGLREKAREFWQTEKKQPDESWIDFSKRQLTGARKGTVSTLTGISSLGERAVKGIGRFITPKEYEETLGFEAPEETGAEKLIPEEWRTAEEGERLGFAMEQIAEFFVPLTKVGKIEKIGKLGETIKVSKAEEFITKFLKIEDIPKKIAKKKIYSTTAKGLEKGTEFTGRLAAQEGELGKEELIGGFGAIALGGVLTKTGSYFIKSLPNTLMRRAVGQSKKTITTGEDVSKYMLEKRKFGSPENMLKESKIEINKLTARLDKISPMAKKMPKEIEDKLRVKFLAEGIPDKQITYKIEEIASNWTVEKNILNQIKEFSTQGLSSKKMAKKFQNAMNRTRRELEKESKTAGIIDKTAPSKYIALYKEVLFKKALEENFSKGSKLFKKDMKLNDIFNFVSKWITPMIIGGVATGSPLGMGVGILTQKALTSSKILSGFGIFLSSKLTIALGSILQKMSPAEKAIFAKVIKQIIDKSKGDEKDRLETLMEK